MSLRGYTPTTVPQSKPYFRHPRSHPGLSKAAALSQGGIRSTWGAAPKVRARAVGLVQNPECVLWQTPSLRCPPGHERCCLKASPNSTKPAFLGRARRVQGCWKGTTAHKNASATCLLLPEIPFRRRFPLHKSKLHFKLEKEQTLLEQWQCIRPYLYFSLSLSLSLSLAHTHTVPKDHPEAQSLCKGGMRSRKRFVWSQDSTPGVSAHSATLPPSLSPTLRNPWF